jgi:hypothetical protein
MVRLWKNAGAGNREIPNQVRDDSKTRTIPLCHAQPSANEDQKLRFPGNPAPYQVREKLQRESRRRPCESRDLFWSGFPRIKYGAG